VGAEIEVGEEVGEEVELAGVRVRLWLRMWRLGSGKCSNVRAAAARGICRRSRCCKRCMISLLFRIGL